MKKLHEQVIGMVIHSLIGQCKPIICMHRLYGPFDQKMGF